MTVSIYTNSVSAHQLPLAREIAKLVGPENFRYVYTNERLQGGAQEVAATDPWVTQDETSLENCDILLVGGIRPIDLMERRLSAGKMTLYMSERWFKPIPFCRLFGHDRYLPGWLRLLVPSYRRMARRFARLFESPYYRFLPIGGWSLHDMKIVCRTIGVEIRESQIMPWGDFVERGIGSGEEGKENRVEGKCRVLWVGRLLDLKRVDTIIRAVGSVVSDGELSTNDHRLTTSMLSIDIYGAGPEEVRLKKMAAKYGNVITFHPPVAMAEVRELMRRHDVYVFASNSFDGWGAVVPEALEEGMLVLGTYEAGASAALLPEENLFHCGDWKGLAKKLSDISKVKRVRLPEGFTPVGAAKRLIAVAAECRSCARSGF